MAGLTPAIDTVRLSLHVLAAAVWVGGQITLAGLVPTIRSGGDELTIRVARAFGRVAWPAYALLIGTGIWNVVASHPGRQGGVWDAILGVKISVALLAGLAAWLHSRASGPLGLAFWGALAGTTSVAALVLGVLLAG